MTSFQHPNTPAERIHCPFCGGPLHDLERVEAKHTPASVLGYIKGYSITRRYVIAQCEKGHLMKRSGGGIFGIATEPTMWDHSHVQHPNTPEQED